MTVFRTKLHGPEIQTVNIGDCWRDRNKFFVKTLGEINCFALAGE